MKTRFSVVIATYNREKYVCETIESVLAQTFKDYEIIIVDDGSTDNTKEILRSRFGDVIRLVEQTNGGSERAYQFGASFANGQYLAFLDSDDLWMPWTLATYDKIIENLDTPPVILGSMLYFRDGDYIPSMNSNIDRIEVWKYRDYFSKEISIGLAQSRIVMHKSVFDKVNNSSGIRREPYKLNDYRLMLLVGTYGPCVITNYPITVAYRQHESQASKSVLKMSQGAFELIRSVRDGADSERQFRRFDRYAFLGGPIMEWSKKALSIHRPEVTLKLLISGYPMIAAAALKKFRQFFCKKATPLVIN